MGLCASPPDNTLLVSPRALRLDASVQRLGAATQPSIVSTVAGCCLSAPQLLCCMYVRLLRHVALLLSRCDDPHIFIIHACHLSDVPVVGTSMMYSCANLICDLCIAERMLPRARRLTASSLPPCAAAGQGRPPPPLHASRDHAEADRQQHGRNIVHLRALLRPVVVRLSSQ